MQSDGVVPIVVEQTIISGEVRLGSTTTVYYDPENRVSVVVGKTSGVVVTVTRGEIRRAR